MRVAPFVTGVAAGIAAGAIASAVAAGALQNPKARHAIKSGARRAGHLAQDAAHSVAGMMD